MIICLRETCCILVFSSWNMMHADFCSWNLLHVDYFVKKLNVSCLTSSRNLLVFSFFFMKLVACWFFSLWNLYIDFSPHETGFVRGSRCICSWNLIYLDISFVILIVWWFILSWNLIFHHIFFRGTCCISSQLIRKTIGILSNQFQRQ